MDLSFFKFFRERIVEVGLREGWKSRRIALSMNSLPSTLVCFAVKEEADAFRRLAIDRPGIRILVTGMGAANAQQAVRRALDESLPGLVLTCGFAGGLNPALESGTVVFLAEGNPGLAAALESTGARPARFHCASRVAVTAAEKRALRETAGADAVEMESGAITEVCAERRVPCATVRVILDTAAEDLPLDFNALMTADMRLNPAKLALAIIMKSPGKIGALRQLQRQSAAAAGRLAESLQRVVGDRESDGL